MRGGFSMPLSSSGMSEYKCEIKKCRAVRERETVDGPPKYGSSHHHVILFPCLSASPPPTRAHNNDIQGETGR